MLELFRKKSSRDSDSEHDDDVDDMDLENPDQKYEFQPLILPSESRPRPRSAPKLLKTVPRDQRLQDYVNHKMRVSGSTAIWLLLFFFIAFIPIFVFEVSTSQYFTSPPLLPVPIRGCTLLHNHTAIPLSECIRCNHESLILPIAARHPAWFVAFYWFLDTLAFSSIFFSLTFAFFQGRRALRLLPFGIKITQPPENIIFRFLICSAIGIGALFINAASKIKRTQVLVIEPSLIPMLYCTDHTEPLRPLIEPYELISVPDLIHKSALLFACFAAALGYVWMRFRDLYFELPFQDLNQMFFGIAGKYVRLHLEEAEIHRVLVRLQPYYTRAYRAKWYSYVAWADVFYWSLDLTDTWIATIVRRILDVHL